MCLVGAIDDATGKIVGGTFRPSEDQVGYLTMLRAIAQTYGIPESVYHDRHTILRSPGKADIDDDLVGREPESQVQRVMRELGIACIAAGSPQAKGRVERLWGTLQDRLVREMRLAGISSLDDANAFLPGYISRYNKRFGHKAANPEKSWVKMERNTDLVYCFSTKESRTVKSDHTISWMGKTLQIAPDSRSGCIAGKKISAHVTPEGEVYLYDGKRRLCHRSVCADQALPDQPPKTKETNQPRPVPNPASVARRRAWLYAPPTPTPAGHFP